MAQVYVAKPQKVHAEQFLTAVTPWDPHVCTEAAPLGRCATAPLFLDWRPHLHGDGQVWELHDTDWITYSVAFPDQLPKALTHAQFEELYGQQPGADIGGV
jgi:hypothetical protein